MLGRRTSHVHQRRQNERRTIPCNGTEWHRNKYHCENLPLTFLSLSCWLCVCVDFNVASFNWAAWHGLVKGPPVPIYICIYICREGQQIKQTSANGEEIVVIEEKRLPQCSTALVFLHTCEVVEYTIWCAPRPLSFWAASPPLPTENKCGSSTHTHKLMCWHHHIHGAPLLYIAHPDPYFGHRTHDSVCLTAGDARRQYI